MVTVSVLIQVAKGLLFLIYPLIGHLTDVYLTRHRSLKWSFGILMLIGIAAVIYSIIDLTLSSVWKLTIFHHYQTTFILAIGFIVYIIG